MKASVKKLCLMRIRFQWRQVWFHIQKNAEDKGVNLLWSSALSFIKAWYIRLRRKCIQIQTTPAFTQVKIVLTKTKSWLENTSKRILWVKNQTKQILALIKLRAISGKLSKQWTKLRWVLAKTEPKQWKIKWMLQKLKVQAVCHLLKVNRNLQITKHRAKRHQLPESLQSISKSWILLQMSQISKANQIRLWAQSKKIRKRMMKKMMKK